MSRRIAMLVRWTGTAIAAGLFAAPTLASQQATMRGPDRIDAAYTKRIGETLRDKRITTELVDFLPASDKVPSPLKFFGHIIGEFGILDKGEKMNEYLAQVAKAAPTRSKYWTMGKSEEGRDMGVMVVGSEDIIRNLDRYKAELAALTDPRKTTEAQAQALLNTAKPIYWITSGMHSPETGGPEMLMELAYRLIVSEQPLIQNIRNNVIVIISPVVEMDGREKVVDAYNFSKAHPEMAVQRNNLMMYWGHYVQHDNNRDGMGQMLALTKNIERFGNEWHPTILHDLHEAQTLLYASTGTGPYNEMLDPITIDEWWITAENDVIEMTKRGVPGVWTYGFYDGWTPNYMFFVAHGHNALGRFYEVQSYGPDSSTVFGGQSREWFRPNPTPPNVQWGPRNNTNIQESAILFALNKVATDRHFFLENYWLKNKRAVAKGTNGPTYGWVIPASQRRKEDAATLVNDMILQGLEFHTANTAFKVGNVDVKPGDWIIRGDQPYRTVADIYFSVQRYAASNPAPYDDTGWTLQYTRDVAVIPITDKALLTQSMTPVKGEVVAAGGIAGTGPVVVVEHTGDNNIVTFRFKLKDVKMSAAEDDFDAAGHHFRAGAIVINNADAAQLNPVLKQLGLSAWAMAAAPAVRTHDLDVPRILYLHTWRSTQDEGWVRGAFEHYGVPFTYIADKELSHMPNLKQQYDVIVYPHSPGTATTFVGSVVTGGTPVPYKKTAETPAFGTPDSTSDIRGGMGVDGLMNLYHFVEQGGTLITEGATSTIFPEYNLTPGVTVVQAPDLFARGVIVRSDINDMKSPLVYGLGYNQMAVYFNQGPVFSVGAGLGRGRGGSTVSQNTQPMASAPPVSVFSPGGIAAPPPPMTSNDAVGQGSGASNAPPAVLGAGAGNAAGGDANAAAGGRGGRGGGGGRGGRGGAGAGAGAAGATPPVAGGPPSDFAAAAGRGGFGGRGGAPTGPAPRVVMSFPSDVSQILLSGGLANADPIAGRAQLVDATIGQGHVVLFGIRPYWRWQTHGTYILGFNALLNWNHLNAGSAAAQAPAAAAGRGRGGN